MHCARTARRGIHRTSYLVVSYFNLLSSVCHCNRITCINNNFNTNVRGMPRTTICNVPILINPGGGGFHRIRRLLGRNKYVRVRSTTSCSTIVSHVLHRPSCLGRYKDGTKRCVTIGTKTASGVCRDVDFWTNTFLYYDLLWGKVYSPCSSLIQTNLIQAGLVAMKFSKERNYYG